MKLSFTVLALLIAISSKSEVYTNALQLTVQLSNTVYFLDEPMLAKITYKNVSPYEIKFYKEFSSFPSPRILFDLQRIKMSDDKGDEISVFPIKSSSPTLPNIPSEWKVLKPSEEYTATIDLNDLVKNWELKPGTHQLILIHKTYIIKNENGKYDYVLNSEGKDRWPSEPFTLTLRSPRTIQAYAKTKENVLKLTVHPTNITASVSEMIPVGLTFKNISKHRIKFPTIFQLFPDDEYFYLERFSTPDDKGDEIVYSPKLSEVFSFVMNREFNKSLLPQEEHSTTIDLKRWVKLCQLKPGTHRLVLVFKYPVTIYEADGKEGKHVEGKHGRDAIWPSEPFTLTLEAPKSSTIESSK